MRFFHIAILMALCTAIAAGSASAGKPLAESGPQTARFETMVIENGESEIVFVAEEDILIKTIDLSVIHQETEACQFVLEDPFARAAMTRIFLDDDPTQKLSSNVANVRFEPGLLYSAGDNVEVHALANGDSVGEKPCRFFAVINFIEFD